MSKAIQITLAAARVNAGYSQNEASVLLGITAKTLRGYEQGVTAIPGYRLRKASKLYNLPEDMIRLPIVEDGEYNEEEKNLTNSTV